MDPDLRDFMAKFSEFIEYASEFRIAGADDGEALHAVLGAYLGADAGRVPVISREFSPHRHADVDVALNYLAGSDLVTDAALIGVRGGEDRLHNSLSELIENSARFHQFSVGTVDYVSVPVGPDERRKVVSFGIWLLTFEREKLAVLFRGPNPQYGQDETKIEVLCADDNVSDTLIGVISRLSNEKSTLRGQMISLGGSDYDDSTKLLTFHARPRIGAADVILPGSTLARIERHVLGMGRYAETLKAAGQHLKRGVLLYGPPGTGKTHTVRYLAGQATDSTIIMLSGSALSAISYAAETARALQPSIVVLEDCDLVAQDRDYMEGGSEPLLFNLLDTLDGLAEDSDVAFVLTTNRADLLEPALSQRPGRVDLAAEIPLPDTAARRELFGLYAQMLGFSDDALAEAAERTDGTPASYAKELIRRTVLIAAEQDRAPNDDDLLAAISELRADSEAFTRSLLGHRGDDELDAEDEFDEDDDEF